MTRKIMAGVGVFLIVLVLTLVAIWLKLDLNNPTVMAGICASGGGAYYDLTEEE